MATKRKAKAKAQDTLVIVTSNGVNWARYLARSVKDAEADMRAARAYEAEAQCMPVEGWPPYRVLTCEPSRDPGQRRLLGRKRLLLLDSGVED